jgi:DNA-directed RNA polymerase subunit RPC12/RpoP
MEEQYQLCPICGKQVKSIPRYPKYICADCARNVADAKGRKVALSSVDIDFKDDAFNVNEGFYGFYVDSKEEYRSHICYIQGVKCRADLARFGGIVIEKID